MVILITAVSAVVSCREQAPPAPEHEVQASSLPRITVKAGARMLFTYARPDRSFESVDSLDKVPKEHGGWVRVVDLEIKPHKRLDHELVYVADLREKRKDGTFPYVVLPRSTFESGAANRASPGAASGPGQAGLGLRYRF